MCVCLSSEVCIFSCAYTICLRVFLVIYKQLFCPQGTSHRLHLLCEFLHQLQQIYIFCYFTISKPFALGYINATQVFLPYCKFLHFDFSTKTNHRITLSDM